MAKTLRYAFLVTLLCALLSACGGGDSDTPGWSAASTSSATAGDERTVASTLTLQLAGPDVSSAPASLIRASVALSVQQRLSQPVARLEVAAALFAVGSDGQVVQLGLARTVSADMATDTLAANVAGSLSWADFRVPPGSWKLMAEVFITAYTSTGARIAALGPVSLGAEWLASQ